jgi:S-DNA-T family DNA segregation ATPase FtsK/SpoIIIE
MEEIKKQKHKFAYEGLLGAGITTLGYQVLAPLGLITISPIVTFLIVSASTIGGIVLDAIFKEDEYEKLFKMCGLINKDNEVPLVIKKTKDDIKTTLVIHLPAGLSQSHFESKQEELEQYLNCKIKFGFNKNLIIELIQMNLSTMYNYVFEEQKNPLQIYIGNTHEGKFIIDIEKCPHMLIAGETGGGKSSLLDTITTSLIINPYDIELHFIDFQAVTLGKYENCKKVKSYGETPEEFDILLDKMALENGKRLKAYRSVKNKHFIDKLSLWNELYPEQRFPQIVVIVDEFERLAQEKYKEIFEKFLIRISMDRKVGIHYILSLQRPDVKAIEGSIKANIPCRIAFKTTSEIDSKVILDCYGAEKLKNEGRFLIKYQGEIKEVQGLFVEPDKRIRKILKEHKAFKSRDEIAYEDRQREKEEAERLKKEKQKIDEEMGITQIPQPPIDLRAIKQQIIYDYRKNNKYPYKRGD